jgi:hypothetical protein
MHLEGLQVVSSHLWALLCTGLTGWGHLSNRSECWSYSQVEHRSDRWCRPISLVRVELLQLLCFMKWFTCICLEGVVLVQGELACVQVELFVVLSYGLLVCALCLSMSCLGCVEPLPLPKRSKNCLLQVILLFAFSLVFDLLLEVLLVVYFLFLFSFGYCWKLLSPYPTLNLEQISLHQILHHSCRVIN